MLSRKEIFESRGYNVPFYVLDADGKRVEIETSENEEQSVMYDRIVTLLVSAGYFRARIKGISPFDVVVGGMTWCLDSSSIDLNVDFLFREDLNTGQKIALTEKIVVVLPRIKCPYFIEPHQIQGLDFIHIHPVIEWLIKWSSENREKKAKYMEMYAINQYYKNFDDLESIKSRQTEAERRNCVRHVLERYQPRRICKQSNTSLTDLKLKIESTLAEYGLSDIYETPGYIVKSDVRIKLNKEEIECLTAGLNFDEYSKEKLNFENAERLLEADFRIINTERKLNNLKSNLEELKVEKDRLTEAVEAATAESAELAAKHEEKIVELESLAEEEQKIVKHMQSLIQVHEKLKEKENNFKEQCKIEINDLETEITELENNTAEKQAIELRVQMEYLQSQLLNNKRELGKVTRSVLKKEHAIDQIPSRAELSQYQKRFLELYNQLAQKHNETKRYFILFNTLNDKFTYLENEFSILNSIHDTFLQVYNTSSNKDEFMRQLQGIVAGIQNAKEKILEKRNENRRMRERLGDHLAYLQRLKIDYLHAVKELSDIYKGNEALQQLLQKKQEAAEDLASS